MLRHAGHLSILSTRHDGKTPSGSAMVSEHGGFPKQFKTLCLRLSRALWNNWFPPKLLVARKHRAFRTGLVSSTGSDLHDQT